MHEGVCRPPHPGTRQTTGLTTSFVPRTDFILIDFEGDADLPLTQRRMKILPSSRHRLDALVTSAYRTGGPARTLRIPRDRRRGIVRSWKSGSISGISGAAATFLRGLPGTHRNAATCSPSPHEAVQPLLDLYFAEKCITMLLRDLSSVARARQDATAQARLSHVADATIIDGRKAGRHWHDLMRKHAGRSLSIVKTATIAPTTADLEPRFLTQGAFALERGGVEWTVWGSGGGGGPSRNPCRQ